MLTKLLSFLVIKFLTYTYSTYIFKQWVEKKGSKIVNYGNHIFFVGEWGMVVRGDSHLEISVIPVLRHSL
jgi:hypothetical protein